MIFFYLVWILLLSIIYISFALQLYMEIVDSIKYFLEKVQKRKKSKDKKFYNKVLVNAFADIGTELLFLSVITLMYIIAILSPIMITNGGIANG